MNKLLACSFIVFSLTSLSIVDTPDETLHNKCIYPTVKLEIPEQSGGGGGSGVIVRSDKKDNKFINVVVTAAHVLTNGPVQICVPKFKNWSILEGYDKYSCAVFSASQSRDLAIIIFESPTKMPVAEIDFDAKLFIGNQIIKLGFGVGDECRFDKGEITSVFTHTALGPISPGHMRLNAYTIFGDSGGPCYLASNYKLIGITKAIRGFQGIFLTNFAYASPIAWLKTWSAENQNSMDFVFDSTKPIPFTVAELQKRNTLLNLKAQIETVKQDIQTKTQEITAKKQMEESLGLEIKRIEEGRELPIPPMPVAPPPPTTPSNTPNNDEQSNAPAPAP